MLWEVSLGGLRAGLSTEGQVGGNVMDEVQGKETRKKGYSMENPRTEARNSRTCSKQPGPRQPEPPAKPSLSNAPGPAIPRTPTSSARGWKGT